MFICIKQNTLSLIDFLLKTNNSATLGKKKPFQIVILFPNTNYQFIVCKTSPKNIVILSLSLFKIVYLQIPMCFTYVWLESIHILIKLIHTSTFLIKKI